MKIILSKNKLVKFIYREKNLGFVPTMGAIHKGHISLIKKSISQNNKTVVSIFINKPQFSRKFDFQKYPRVLKNDILKIYVKSVKSPIDNEQNIPTKVMIIPNPTVALVLLHPFLSIKYAVTTSNIEIADVSAAKNNKKKNRVPHTNPPASWGKMVGRTTKINPGPSAGLAPRANTVVKIATPASIAMAVSKVITHNAELRKVCFRPR